LDSYSQPYVIRWSDLDANAHVRYSAYIDAAGDVRYSFFTEHGYPPEKFAELGVGPVYTSLRAEFLREVRLGESVTITFALAGLSSNGARWRVHHDVLKANGKKAVSMSLEGAIIDLATRRAVLPTGELAGIFGRIPRLKEFEVLPDARRMG
jgi:acyl-CoA thioester hydrolase